MVLALFVSETTYSFAIVDSIKFQGRLLPSARHRGKVGAKGAVRAVRLTRIVIGRYQGSPIAGTESASIPSSPIPVRFISISFRSQIILSASKRDGFIR